MENINFVKRLLKGYGVEYKTRQEALERFERLTQILKKEIEPITHAMEAFAMRLFKKELKTLNNEEWITVHHITVSQFLAINYPDGREVLQ